MQIPNPKELVKFVKFESWVHSEKGENARYAEYTKTHKLQIIDYQGITKSYFALICAICVFRIQKRFLEGDSKFIK